MIYLLLGVLSGIIGLGYLTLVIASLFLGGTWAARSMLGFIGVGSLFVSFKLLRFYAMQLRGERHRPTKAR